METEHMFTTPSQPEFSRSLESSQGSTPARVDYPFPTDDNSELTGVTVPKEIVHEPLYLGVAVIDPLLAARLHFTEIDVSRVVNDRALLQEILDEYIRLIFWRRWFFEPRGFELHEVNHDVDALETFY
jgi:hypothetical protein